MLTSIREILETDRRWAVYALGDLEPPHAEFSEWRTSADGSALILLYRRVTPNVLFTLGAPEQLRPLLTQLTESELYLLVRPEILPVLKERYAVQSEIPMWRMVLEPSRFPTALAEGAVRLGVEAVPALETLFADGQVTGEEPDFFFPALVAEGAFFGIWEGAELVAAAGTHLVSEKLSVGAVGCVYVRRDRRGRGLARAVTQAVTAHLLARGLQTIALNVKQNNAPAIHVYETLGYERYCAFYEGTAKLKG
jgi:ribosomal protein S18 acetylase RimI-like enzyme